MRRLQLLAYSWAVRCFGIIHVEDANVRILRLYEEVLELAQAKDISIEKLDEVKSIVYSRPKGDFYTELGGVALTFAVLCESHGRQVEDVLMIELNRVLSKPQEHFAKRNLEKVQP